MVNALRKKIVFITMLIMLTTTSLLILAFYHYFSYWVSMDLYQMAELAAQSGVFTGYPLSEDADSFVDNAVVGVTVDPDGNILKKRSIGNDNDDTKTEKLVAKILKNRKGEWREGSYVYSKKELPDGNTLITYINIDYHHDNITFAAEALILTIIGVSVVFITMVGISRFVTDPVKEELAKEKRFVTDASHELKTPLGAISINAQALNAGEDNIHIRNIISETDRMNRLVERLLTLARLEESEEKPKERFSATAAAEEMALTYESVAYEQKTEFTYDIKENVYSVGDVEEFKQLVAILLDNSLKHTKEKDRIGLSLAKEGHRTVLKVTNSGEPISEEDLPHIFERFYSSDRLNNKGSFGLGLSIAKAITERAGGTIDAANTKDGTCFTVTI